MDYLFNIYRALCETIIIAIVIIIILPIFAEEESMLWNVKCIDQSCSVQKEFRFICMQQFPVHKTYVFITIL